MITKTISDGKLIWKLKWLFFLIFDDFYGIRSVELVKMDMKLGEELFEIDICACIFVYTIWTI